MSINSNNYASEYLIINNQNTIRNGILVLSLLLKDIVARHPSQQQIKMKKDYYWEKKKGKITENEKFAIYEGIKISL